MMGHNDSYYTKGDTGAKEDYTKAMADLTFTDYSALDKRQKNVETQLEQKDNEIIDLKKRLSEVENKSLDMKAIEELIDSKFEGYKEFASYVKDTVSGRFPPVIKKK